MNMLGAQDSFTWGGGLNNFSFHPLIAGLGDVTVESGNPKLK